ncbi:MAG TPA: rhodanese-like domain-containing protein [Candidatus Thermoplasmatota archaeon]|nr:rhodanese-like domain-containing protein [Candidatus Thermoplasmatota archaeon]
MPKSAKDMVTEAKQTIENLSVGEVAKELQRGDVLLVDVREPEERTQNGTIPGAIAAPRGMLEFYADPATPYHKKELEPRRRIILHCASGGRSALAARTLKEMGFENVAHLDGGFKAWKEAGQPTGPGR